MGVGYNKNDNYFMYGQIIINSSWSSGSSSHSRTKRKERGELYCSNSSTVKALVGGICLVCTPMTPPWHLITGQLNNNVLP